MIHQHLAYPTFGAAPAALAVWDASLLAVVVDHPQVDRLQDAVDGVLADLVERPRNLPPGRDADVVAVGSHDAIRQGDVFEHVPVRMLRRRRQVGLVRVSAEMQPPVLDAELGSLGLRHLVDHAGIAGGVGQRLGPAAGLSRDLAVAVLPGMVDQLDRHVAALGQQHPLAHDGVDGDVVVLADLVAGHEGVHQEHVDPERSDLPLDLPHVGLDDDGAGLGLLPGDAERGVAA